MLATTAALAVAATTPALAGAAPADQLGRLASPTFRSYAAPAAFTDTGGEPTIGVNRRTGAVLYQAVQQTFRVDGFDHAGPGTAHWRDVSPPGAASGSLDAILETDPRAGRTWVSHLSGYCSHMAFSDDDGASWTDVPLGCSPGAMADHQSVGAGPFPAGAIGAAHPSAVYYCANYVAGTSCGVSRDGGRTFGPAGPVAGPSSPPTCGIGWGLHVAGDGTAYLPPYACGLGDGPAQAGLYATRDAGLTWSVHVVPGSSIGFEQEPGVATDAAGTVYLLWGAGGGPGNGGPPQVAVSRDHGSTWTSPLDLGAAFGIRNTRHTTAVGGDAGRAAVAFLGAREEGDDQDPAYAGVWHLYVALTYDSGRTWQTVDATPDSPVQVGAICMSGLRCGKNRNLYDFNDLTIDADGRVLAAITDGCPSPRCSNSVRERRPVIVRQVSGQGLLLHR